MRFWYKNIRLNWPLKCQHKMFKQYWTMGVSKWLCIKRHVVFCEKLRCCLLLSSCLPFAAQYTTIYTSRRGYVFTPEYYGVDSQCLKLKRQKFRLTKESLEEFY